MDLFFYRHNSFIPAPPMMRNETSFYELTIALEGSLCYTVNDEAYTLLAGDAIFIKQGSLRSRLAVTGAEYISFNFHSSEDELYFPRTTFIKNGVTRETKLLLSACDEIRADLSYDKERLALITKCIMLQFKRRLALGDCSSLTISIKKYISEHLYENISLADIGRATSFAPNYCANIFKKETGSSIINYTNELKIREAKNMIVEGADLSAAAQALGFQDYNYFSRIFKKRTGCTPMQFKHSIKD